MQNLDEYAYDKVIHGLFHELLILNYKKHGQFNQIILGIMSMIAQDYSDVILHDCVHTLKISHKLTSDIIKYQYHQYLIMKSRMS